jgi:hypothetical protein
LYAEGLEISGGQCLDCRSLVSDALTSTCPYCGVALKPSDNLLDLALTRAIDSGARIEQVRGRAADSLREVGGIGAFLRF